MFLERANARDTKWMLGFHVAQTGKHLLRTQNQKQFLCPGHKICVRQKCCARGQTEKRGNIVQQCVRNNVSSFARALSSVKTKGFEMIHYKITSRVLFLRNKTRKNYCFVIHVYIYSKFICITVDGLKWQIDEADGLHGYYGFTETILHWFSFSVDRKFQFFTITAWILSRSLVIFIL